MLTSAAGNIYAARLPINLKAHLIEQEWDEVFGGKADVGKFREDESRELKRRGYTTIVRLDLSGYVSITAPVLDWNGDVRFTLSQVIPELTLRFRGHISFPRQSSQRRVNHKSGLEGPLLQRPAFR
jgi:DNA-binding IclR family transcriptional regulator